MKKVFWFGLIMLLSVISHAQNIVSMDQVDPNKMYVITKNDGTTFMGKILSIDAREITIRTSNIGDVSIPKHEIRDIKEVKAGDVNARGELVTDDAFATRYFLTTNGLPIAKGESYILWNLFGPDVQFAVSDNLGLGVMTSWFGVPLIGSIKYSIPTEGNVGLGFGALLGTGSWASPNFGLALPFAALTVGNKKTNFNFSAGYGAVFIDGISEGKTLLSVGFLSKFGKNMSFVFDSVIVPGSANSGGVSFFIPGLRWQSDVNKAFQFGFLAAGIDGDVISLPLPMLGFFRTIN